MLITLSLRDVVLVESLVLEPRAGLTALTGETGAGKSILLDGLALALGARADAGLVRAGADAAVVTAAFDVPDDHRARALLAESGLDASGPLLLRRLVKADGGSRAFINDQPVGLTLLRDIGDSLIEVHGQQDDRGLLNPRGHRALLDAFGGHEKLLAATVAAHRGWSDATQALAQARADLAAAERDHDYLAHAAAEIARLAPEPGEETRLAESRSTMMKAARLGEDLAGVLEGLSGEAGALALLRQSARRLERLTDADPVFAAAVADLDAAIERSADAEDRLERWLAASPFNATLLEQSESRLFELRGLARKHKVAVDDLAALGADIDARLALIAQGERTVARLEADVARQWQAFGECCAALARARAAAARRLDKAVAAELVPLKLDKAKFRTAVEPLPPAQWSASGGDRVEFEVSTNPGASFGALTRIASGGELSRFVLALKVALAATGSASTLIFDEIDRGVGGAVAAAIGERLAQLAGHVQVILVTHSPQVAARAAHQWRIAKSGAQTAVTEVRALDANGRREEIARMLSGDTITEEARAQAARLLAAE